jgi:hypothetical protein
MDYMIRIFTVERFGLSLTLGGFQFYYAESSNQKIGNWNVGAVTNMGGMVRAAE